LREKQVRSVGVTKAGGKLAGVISHSDISDKVAAENKCPAWMKVSDIMTRELVTVTPEMTLEDCLRLMEQNTIFHLIVLDERQDSLACYPSAISCEWSRRTRRRALICWNRLYFAEVAADQQFY